MKPLSPQAQLLLSRYKTTQSLRGSESARLLDVIHERALSGELPRFDVDAAPPVIPDAALLQPFWVSPLAKAALGIVLVGVPASIVWVWNRDSQDPPPAAARISVSPPHIEPPMTPPALPPELPELVASSEGSRATPEATLPKPRRTVASAEPTIDEEMRLLNAAQTALRENDAKRALQLLSEHATRFPSGKMGSAREVTRMLALCQSGRGVEARAEAERFLARHPVSAFTARVKNICAMPKP